LAAEDGEAEVLAVGVAADSEVLGVADLAEGLARAEAERAAGGDAEGVLKHGNEA
jgi:hypothetical protein